MEKSEKVLLISSIVLVGFFVAVLFHYVLGAYLGLNYPYNTFLFRPDLSFADFKDLLFYVKDFAPFKSSQIMVNYFPLAYILLFPFTFIKSKIIAYIVFASIFLCFFIYSNIKNINCENLTKLQNFQNIFIITILSYPVLMLLDRGNFDMLLFVLFGLFISSFESKKYLLSSIILALINAMKPFTLIFLILFLFKRKFKELLLSIILTILLIIGGFIALKGNFFNQIFILITNLEQFRNLFFYNIQLGIYNTSSFFMALKFLFCSNLPLISPFLLAKIYGYISFLMTFVTIFFAWKEKIFWKRISLITLYMLVFPYVVFDYKLIFLFVPLWLFINAQEKSNFDLAYTIIFGLLLIPKIFFLIGVRKLILFSVIVNPILMLVFMGLIIFEQFQLKQKEKIHGD